MEVMKAKQWSYFISNFYIIVTDRALSYLLGLIFWLDEVRPVFLHRIGINFLGVYSKIDDPLLHDDPSVLNMLLLLSNNSWNKITISLYLFELKLALNNSKEIVVSNDVRTDPTFSNFNLIFFTLNPKSASTILNLNSIMISNDSKINLWGMNRNGGLISIIDIFFRF